MRRILFSLFLIGLLMGTACEEEAGYEREESLDFQPQMETLDGVLKGRPHRLDPELAARILSGHFQRSPVRSLMFREGGVEKAERKEIIENLYGNVYQFTEKGLSLAGGAVDPDSSRIRSVGSRENGSLLYGFTPADPLEEELIAIDSISGGDRDTLKRINYRSRILLPEEAGALAGYLELERRGEAQVRHFDQTWKLEKIERQLF